jgi:SAM-dependent methyltransferase
MTARATAARLTTNAKFAPIVACWICGGRQLVPYHTLRFDLDAYLNEAQDPELAGYTGETLDLVRCASCGFGQPAALPTLPNYFDRMYDQRWSERWIVEEFESTSKDFIFRSILRELERRLGRTGRLLDVGAHAGRFLHLAKHAGWDVEGIELNPRTAAYAAVRTGVAVHRINAHALADSGRRYEAVVLTDVLEHIPQPIDLLATLARLTVPDGIIAVKVPCGPSQALKEHVLAAVSSHRATLADNLVHVNHFSPPSLKMALERAGFTATIRTAAPELRPLRSSPSADAVARDEGAHRFSGAAFASNAVRLATYALARLPGAVSTPAALHLQAFGARQPR